ncbi:hypothetical protein SDC9_75214 [bioreactor metagenome]|uniref:HTH tetR-type domain-containing protein n=1 Tax=bioreactor metagenome TaxID=1076179 RepID=A0A644YK66_9ZZZZ
MYATNDNRQAMESRDRICEALLNLMVQYQYKDITVTQICQEAQIVRQTYYRNFEQRDDILRYYLDNMVRLFFSDYFREDDVRTQLRIFFEYMLLSRDFLVLVSKNSLIFMLEEVITQNITAFFDFRQIKNTNEPRLEKYVTRYIAATICSLLSLWILSEFDESPDTLSSLAQRFFAGVSGGKLSD